MKSSFPFPFCLSTGHKKARRHYLHAIQSGRKDDGNLGELNAIAVLSMKRVINNFTYNLKLMVPHKEGKLFKGKKRKANTPLYFTHFNINCFHFYSLFNFMYSYVSSFYRSK